MRTPKWTIFEDISHSFEECFIWNPPLPQVRHLCCYLTFCWNFIVWYFLLWGEKKSRKKKLSAILRAWFHRHHHIKLSLATVIFLIWLFPDRTEMPIFVQVFENNLTLQLNIMGSFLPSSGNCLGEDSERQYTANHLRTFNMTEETRPSPLRFCLSRSHCTWNPLHLEIALWWSDVLSNC